MKAKVLKTINLILFILAALVVVGQAFAWFTVESKGKNLGFGGASQSAYFAGGDGSSTNPYRISNSKHVYNLAWLQDKGYIESGTSFLVTSDIDMGGVILPPIGTAQHPFNGVFNGGGHTIVNLCVSTDKDVLTDVADNDIVFSNYVGMFGETGTASDIKNFILTDARVEVAAKNVVNKTDVLYASSSIYAGESKYVGIVVGDVKGKVSTIGVKGGHLSVQVAGYSTYNSILGKVDSNKVFVTGGTTGQTGDGNSFGSNFNVNGILSRLYSIYENQYGVTYAKNSVMTDGNNHAATYSTSLPNISTKNTFPVISSGEKIAFSVDSSSSYSGTSAAEVVSENNVGYIIGNQNKIDQKVITFADSDDFVVNGNAYAFKNSDGTYTTAADARKTPDCFFTHVGWGDNNESYDTTYTTSNVIKIAKGSEEYENLHDNIKKLITNPPTDNKYTAIRLVQGNGYKQAANGQGLGDGNILWNYHGQISWMGNLYGENVANGNSKGILLPNNAIWFKPSLSEENKTFRFVIYAEKSGEGFGLYKITRSNATATNPFNSLESQYGADVSIKMVTGHKLPARLLFYFEYTVSDEDIKSNNVEFMLMNFEGNSSSDDDNPDDVDETSSTTGNGGAYFLYLDIGASGDNNASTPDDGEYAETYDVSAVDFVYDGTDSNTEIIDNNFYVNSQMYTPTGRRVYFSECVAGVYLEFIRNTSGDFAVTSKYKKNYKTTILLSTLETSTTSFTLNEQVVSDSVLQFTAN